MEKSETTLMTQGLPGGGSQVASPAGVVVASPCVLPEQLVSWYKSYEDESCQSVTGSSGSGRTGRHTETGNAAMEEPESDQTHSLQIKRKISSAFTRGMRVALEHGTVQKIYEEMLWEQVRNGPIPEHIGIILDGNRRWARRRGLDPWKGHEEGAKKVEDFLDWCGAIEKIRTITLYAFSTENFTRSPKEVTEIFRLLEHYLKSLLKDERIVRNEIRVKILGRINMLPEEFQDLIREGESKTAHYSRHFFNFAVAYGGRTEIVDAVRSIAQSVKEESLSLDDIDEGTIEGYLYTSHLPKCSSDLIIRTSGEVRLSNFLTWQGAYSELCFVDVFWPDFRKMDLLRAIRTYQNRHRRFGE